jgi:Mlc titration factor MtfA (ptsG expression regulator)
MTTVNFIIIVAGSTLVYFIGRHFLHQKKRRRLLTMPLPEQWEQIVQRNVPLYNRLPIPLKKQLHGLINVFVSEKHFEGCGGLKITDEIKVTIAAQACILLLNRKTSCFRKLHTILVYPHTYVAQTKSSNGIITIDGHSIRLGESWQNGPVVLAWDSVTGGMSNVTDARNVVLHEFAHQLDQEDGAADGAPILEHRSSYVTWARVLSREYEDLQKRRGGRSVINEYGAINPAEFFAVATETFFEKPKQMKKNHPELYEELKNYYKVDPYSWE